MIPAAFVPLLILAPLLIFWVVMARDMLANDDIPDYQPNKPFNWPPESKNQWMFAFIFFNLFAAGYYYFTIYRFNH